MKLKIDYISFVVIIFVVLFILRMGWLYIFIPNDKLIAENGQLTINHELINDNKYMYIEGEWLIITEQEQQYIDADAPKQQYSQSITLMMDVNLTEAVTQPMMIGLPPSQHEIKVYIDDVLLNEVKDNHGSIYYANKVRFNPDNKKFVIKVVVSDETGKVKYPISKRYIAISSAVADDNRNELNTISKVLVLGVLCMILFSMSIFYLFVNRSALAIYIILVILFPTIGEVYTILSPLSSWMRLPDNIEAKWYTLIYYLSNFMFILLLNHITGKNKIRHMDLIITVYAVTFVFLLLLPIEYLNIASIYLFIFYATWIIYCFAHTLRHYIISRYEMFSLLYVGLSVLSGLIWGVVKDNVNYNVPFYTYDYFGILLGFTGFWFNRFIQNADAIKKSDIKKERFLQQVSEQLTMPLNQLEIDLNGYYNSTKNLIAKEKLQAMTTTVKGMSFTLNNWLDYSKLKDQSFRSQSQPVDIMATLNYVSEVIKNTLKLPNKSLIIDYSKNIPIILGDSKLLSQTLYNLIYYQLERIRSKTVHIDCTFNSESVTMKIEDATLKGQNKFIWSTETDIPISIQICSSIIAEQGGSLTIKENGFTVRLPIHDEYAQMERLPLYETIHDEKGEETNIKEGMEILVYSSEINTLASLQTVIAETADKLTQVNCYGKFMETYNKQSWDLIVLESTLSDSSSLNMLLMIRERFNLIDLPVLIVLVPTTTSFISTYFECGMNDYITRPIQGVELKYKIQTLLHYKRLLDHRLQLEASLLQNQVEPHFLFNTLNSIASLSKIDVDRMVLLLEQLGHYLSRGFKKRLMKKVIDLQDEIDIVRSYLYIEELRYEPFLKVEWDVDEIIAAEIPPYSIQTLVENAIMHGIRKKKRGGTIKIIVKKRSDFIEVAVKDDGVGMPQEKLNSLLQNHTDNGIGIYNTHIRLLHSVGTGLEIESELDKGTTVKIKLPIPIK